MSLEKEAKEYLKAENIDNKTLRSNHIINDNFTQRSRTLTTLMSDFATQQTENLRDENKRLEEKLSEVDGKNYDLESKDMELQQTKEKLKKYEDWIPVEKELPTELDEDYIVCVKNKNKPDGIYLIDCRNFTSDKIWVGGNTWENVTHWKRKLKLPN